MVPRQIAINRHILVQIRQNLLRARRAPPIPHQITHNRKQTIHLYARPRHLLIRRIPHQRRRRPTRLNIRIHTIPRRPQTQAQKRSAHVRRDARDNDLLLAASFNSRAKLRVVPRVDFALAAYEGRGGVHFDEFFGEGAVGTRVGGRGEDDGDVEEGAEGGVCVDVVLVERGVEVARDVVEADLDVENEEERVVPVETFPWDS